MTRPAPPPAFTLRGHKVGVSALAHREPSTLYSGDEQGDIISWDLVTFKQAATWTGVCRSKILSLKIVRLTLGAKPSSEVLVVQSRDDGIHLCNIDTFEQLTTLPTCPSLFSKGDAMTKGDEALLAYPSAIESHLVTVRYLGEDAKTLISGSASRTDGDTKRRESTVFDIILRAGASDGEIHLFVAYEDGCIAVFNFQRARVKTVPELDVTGLKIDLVSKLEFGFSDFVSAFDVIDQSPDSYAIVCGSAKKELIFSIYGAKSKGETGEMSRVIMNKPGACCIAIRPDKKLVAAAGWDNSVRIYSFKSHRHCASLKNHQKQVSDVAFVGTPDEQKILMCCSSLDGTISVYDIFN